MDGYVTYRNYYVDDELYHHGIKGQKWGIRRYQNEDGTLTEEGKRRYGTVENLERHEKRIRDFSTLKSGITTVGSLALNAPILSSMLVAAGVASGPAAFAAGAAGMVLGTALSQTIDSHMTKTGIRVVERVLYESSKAEEKYKEYKQNKKNEKAE